MRNARYRLAQRLEDARIRLHLRKAELFLRRDQPGGLSGARQRARQTNLDLLAAYRRRGVFPRNRVQQASTPVFVDNDDRECAVAHLMLRSGQEELVERVRSGANLARVRELASPELINWAGESGLSLGDLARIQPRYPGDLDPNFEASVRLVMFLVRTLASASALWLLVGFVHARDWSRRRWVLSIGALALLSVPFLFDPLRYVYLQGLPEGALPRTPRLGPWTPAVLSGVLLFGVCAAWRRWFSATRSNTEGAAVGGPSDRS